MEYNFNKLKGKIIECFGTRDNFARVIGISSRTLSLKLNNKMSWKQSEIQLISDTLEIKKVEIIEYFFVEKIQ